MQRPRLPHRTLALAGLLAAAVFALAPSASTTHAQSTPRSSAAQDDIRGLWVLRSSLASARGIAQMVETAQRSGFNTLLVQVRGRGDAYYASTLEPRAVEIEDEPASFDPLAVTLTLAHNAGLKVHAWVNVDLVASATTLPRSRMHVAIQHPEWLMVPKTLANALRNLPSDTPSYIGQLSRTVRAQSEQVEGLYLSPVIQASRDYTVSVVSDIAKRYALDGIHLDYLRYPNEQFDYSAGTIAAFRAEASANAARETRERLDRLSQTNITAWPDALPDAWTKFRRDRLTTLATALRTAVTAARPNIIISAAVAPNADEARNGRLQDWRLWARAGLLDALCPMIYTTDAGEFASAVARMKADAGAAAVWAGIGAYRLTPARTTENLRIVRKAGISGVLLYSYDSLTASDAAPNYFSLIRSALLEQAQVPSGR